MIDNSLLMINRVEFAALHKKHGNDIVKKFNAKHDKNEAHYQLESGPFLVARDDRVNPPVYYVAGEGRKLLSQLTTEEKAEANEILKNYR